MTPLDNILAYAVRNVARLQFLVHTLDEGFSAGRCRKEDECGASGAKPAPSQRSE